MGFLFFRPIVYRETVLFASAMFYVSQVFSDKNWWGGGGPEVISRQINTVKTETRFVLNRKALNGSLMRASLRSFFRLR